MVDWVEQLEAAAKQHNALIVLNDVCLSCMSEKMICQPMIIKTKLNLKWLDDHKSILVILCEKCAANSPPTYKIVNNVIKKLLKDTPNGNN